MTDIASKRTPGPRTKAERIERAEREVIRLTGSGPGGHLDRSFRMTVPAEPDRDSDLVLMDGLAAGREAANTYDELLAVAEAARLANGHHYAITRLDRHDEPMDDECGECGNDWPCPGARLRDALAALDAATEREKEGHRE